MDLTFVPTENGKDDIHHFHDYSTYRKFLYGEQAFYYDITSIIIIHRGVTSIVLEDSLDAFLLALME